MKKSLYRQVMFIISLICLVLLISIAIKVGVFVELEKPVILDILMPLITNTYFSGVLCSVLSVLIIYKIQVEYSKRMIKKDVRCNEIINDVYNSIESYYMIADKIPTRGNYEPKKDELKKMDNVELEKVYYDFYKNYKGKIYIMNLSLSYENNDIFVESLQSCFLINLNFKLLNIINNIKNRLPNLRINYPKIEELFEQYEKEHDEKLLSNLEYELSTYFIDLRFMVMYWEMLFDYLEYDPTYIKTFVDTYNDNYDIYEYIKTTSETRNSLAKEIDKKVREEMWKHKIKNFWNK